MVEGCESYYISWYYILYHGLGLGLDNSLIHLVHQFSNTNFNIRYSVSILKMIRNVLVKQSIEWWAFSGIQVGYDSAVPRQAVTAAGWRWDIGRVTVGGWHTTSEHHLCAEEWRHEMQSFVILSIDEISCDNNTRYKMLCYLLIYFVLSSFEKILI